MSEKETKIAISKDIWFGWVFFCRAVFWRKYALICQVGSSAKQATHTNERNHITQDKTKGMIQLQEKSEEEVIFEVFLNNVL